MSGLFGSSSAAATNTVGDLKQDVQLNNPPEDSISDLAFNPNPADPKDFLAVASWDKKVRIYEIHSNGQGEGKHIYEHDGPVLSCDYFKVRASSNDVGGRCAGFVAIAARPSKPVANPK